MTALDAWLASLPASEGYSCISAARRYAFDEAGYDAQYASDPANLTPGRGVVALLKDTSADFSAPAIEIGCGTGLASLGVVESAAYPLVLLTDPSTAFLGITRSKVRGHGFDESRVRYAVLMAEEIDRLPPDTFSLVLLRSTLHHVLDVAAFISAAGRALKPGGALVFQEPCQEGYILMGALTQFLPALARAAGRPLGPEQVKRVEGFANAMKYYSRRDIDKTKAEDKWLFRVDELAARAAAAGLSMDFRPNMAFEYYAPYPPGQPRPGPDTFTPFFRNYAKYCMSWGEGLMRAFDDHMPAYCAYIDGITGPGAQPYLHGVFICRKPAH
ncbi:MAG: class I SAM-dependent methyltransferase [Phycisphaerales bacterium]|nr:class I SAM-dependent methyltransferase [Phycisphaerales bacterium]